MYFLIAVSLLCGERDKRLSGGDCDEEDENTIRSACWINNELKCGHRHGADADRERWRRGGDQGQGNCLELSRPTRRRLEWGGAQRLARGPWVVLVKFVGQLLFEV